MVLECDVHIWHCLFGDPLLYVDGFEQTGESRAEDSVHGVGVM